MQNLIVNNDKKAEYVQFTINMPDGYDKFKIDGINGSIINQNYLNVGDTLMFKFDNRPLRYDMPNKCKATIYTMEYYGDPKKKKYRNALAKTVDTRHYEFIETDFTNVHHAVFMPIYYLYDRFHSNGIYIFNPCDENFILNDLTPESTSKVPLTFLFGTGASVEFTGKYIIGLRHCDDNKIGDIAITVGESISNYRKSVYDANNYELTNAIVNNQAVQQLTTTPNQYGTFWSTKIENLLMKHVETAYTTFADSLVTKHKSYVFAIKDNNEDYTTSNNTMASYNIYIQSDGTTELNGKEAMFKIYDSQAGVETITNGFIIITNTTVNTQRKQVALKYNAEESEEEDPDYKYTVNLFNRIESSSPTVLGASFGSGSYAIDKEHVTENSHFFDISNNSYDELTGNTKYISSDWYYSFGYELIRIVNVDNEELVFNESTDFYIKDHKDDLVQIVCDSSTTYTIVEDATGNEHEVRFMHQLGNTYIFDNFACYVTNVMNAAGRASWFRIYYMNTGIISDVEIVPKTYNKYLYTQYLQQTADYTCEEEVEEEEIIDIDNEEKLRSDIENIYVSAVDDNGHYGLRLSMLPLQNICHEYEVTNIDEDEPNYQLHNKPQEYLNADAGVPAIPLLVFVPHKLKLPFLPYATEIQQYGWFIIRDIDCNIYIDINNNPRLEYFVNDGFETLNVQPIQEDDAKFKTFNGSISYDRSNTMINKLTSNDISGLALDYLNDLLAAKLALYFIPNIYSIYNTFFNTDAVYEPTLNETQAALTLTNHYENDVYTGTHEILLTSCYNIVKLIGTENISKNCIASTMPVASYVHGLFTNTNNTLDEEEAEVEEDDLVDNYPMMFQYTDDGTVTYPNTDGNYNLFYCSDRCLLVNTESEAIRKTEFTTFVSQAYTVVDVETFNNNINDFNTKHLPLTYYNVVDDLDNKGDIDKYGMADSLPVYRIYKNNDFDQTDLTISTGGVKTLHPIFIQQTPKALLCNLSYMYDTAINKYMKAYNSIIPINSSWRTYFNSIFVVVMQSKRQFGSTTLSDAVHLNQKYPIFRFGKMDKYVPNVGVCNLSVSFDTNTIINYLYTQNINQYLDIKDEQRAISPEYNEEILHSIDTNNSLNTNVQMFSNKLFSYYDNVDMFSIVIFTQQYVEQMYNTQDIMTYYYGSKIVDNQEFYTSIVNNVNNLINGNTIFNNLKNCNIFICKLGEFLQYPHILFGVCSQIYNNSLSVSVHNFTMTDYCPPIKSEFKKRDDVYYEYTTSNPKVNQKVNTYYSGVVFKYHQLALGYQNLNNELYDEFVISKSKGNRNILILLVDEFGRKIPNEDTSQGFKNNLYLELSLSSVQPQSPQQQPQ